MVTRFNNDVKKGKVGVVIFKEDFLDFLHIKHEDMQNDQNFQILGVDLNVEIGMYEIKCNYKDNEEIIIEPYTNYNEEYGPIKKGWWETSDADVFVFISKYTRQMIFLPNTEKTHMKIAEGRYEIELNKPSVKGDQIWQSAFQRVPLKDIAGYYSRYQKPTILDSRQ